MSWITLSTTDIHDYLAGPQVRALRQAALAPGQSDPLPQIIADVAERVRAEIRGNPANRVSATAGAIPPELRGHVAALVIEAAQTRIPTLALTPAQKAAAENARRLIARVGAREVPIATPDDPQEPDLVQRARRVELVRTRESINSTRLQGL